MISQILFETRSPATTASPASDLATALAANASPARTLLCRASPRPQCRYPLFGFRNLV